HTFSERELSEGWRLSCTAYPKDKCKIWISSDYNSDFSVITDYEGSNSKIQFTAEEEYSIAIDLGTTTLAIALVGRKSKEILDIYTAINGQRVYGADVITRIQASNEGKRHLLQESIQKDLLEGIRTITKRTGVVKNKIKTIAIAGNTAMGHMLLGYSCENIGRYPFTTENINTIKLSFEEALHSDYLEATVLMLPGISAFVGGDIVSGLLACEFNSLETPCLFIDLGTNGEMAVGGKDKILVSSTAAGPAFEGGNLSCGVGSIAGAISSVRIEEGTVSYQTIGDLPPVGICGTGIIEIVSEFLKMGIIDETGLFMDQYFDTGYEIAKDSSGKSIRVTQKDIREIQLAKAAIRAGVETLLKGYGITEKEIDTVYLAGGFGYKIDISKAVQIGLLPEGLSDRIRAIGNSSLSGTVKYLLEEEALNKVEYILHSCEEIVLANDILFNTQYIKQMNF
ncbi:MAG: ASKHA domain-containing protein, partial [Mobilitalea sp.]